MWAVLALLLPVHGKHLLLIGETGAGKSTLGNRLLGREAFTVGHDLKSCTSESQTEIGKLLGGDMQVEVTDTGGLGDSEGRDERFVKDVAAHVRARGGFDGILYVHNACVPRMTKGAQNAMLEMLHTLADDRNRRKLWRHFGLVLTQCDMYRPVYTSQLPGELRRRFSELDFDVPIFWFLKGETTVMSAVASLMDGGRSLKEQLTSWVKSLPRRFTLPSETKREELKRQFEENRKQEQQERQRMQELEAEVRRLKSQAEGQESQRQQLQDRIRRLEAQATPSYSSGYSSGGSRYSSGGGCFSKASLVAVQGKGTIEMSEIQVGDRLATVGGYVEVVAWMHRELGVVGDAMEIVSQVGTLRLTPDHLLFVESPQGVLAVPAREVAGGDRVVVAEGVAKVNVVTKTEIEGYMLPLTTSGDLLVDGMLASCYGEVGWLSHDAINMLMAPFRSPGFPKWLLPQTDEAWRKYAIALKNIVWLFR